MKKNKKHKIFCVFTVDGRASRVSGPNPDTFISDWMKAVSYPERVWPWAYLEEIDERTKIVFNPSTITAVSEED